MAISIEQLHENMLLTMSNEYQKSAGFPAYDFTRAFAFAAANLSDDIEIAKQQLDPANLSGDDLEEYIFRHRGLSRKQGSRATATIEILTGSGTIAEGDRFATASGLVFEATEGAEVSAGDEFTVEAITGGSEYNVAAETITALPVTIAGIGTFTNPEPATGGTDDETDAALLERYYNDLLYPTNGSNAQSYINWALSVSGVGRAKCFPLEGGQNKVGVCVTSATMGAASSEVVAAVQALIDPNSNGDGSGVAPIGAICTVSSAAELTVNVSATLTLATGYTVSGVKPLIEAEIRSYLQEIAFKRTTETTYQTYVSLSKVGECLFNVQGVVDFSALKLNGSAASVTLTSKQVPVLGAVTLS